MSRLPPPKLERIHRYFAETAFYSTDKEKEEAIQYLKQWKKFLINNLTRDSFHINVISEEFIERPGNCIATVMLISLKVCLEIEFEDEICWKYR